MSLKRLKSLFLNFHRDTSGAVAIMFVFFLNIILGMLALSMDLGRGYLASAEVQNAATAAAISSAIEAGDIPAARRYFQSNLPNGLHSIGYDFDSDVQVTVSGGSVSVVPSGFDLPAFFPMGKMSASAAGNGGFLQVGSISTVGMPQGQVQPADYFFVLDTSGSMEQLCPGCNDSISPVTGQPTSRLQSVREATSRVITTISNTPDAAQNYAVSIVGWSDPSTWIEGISVAPPLSTDWAAHQTAASSLVSNGGTCGECGLDKSASYLPLSQPGRTKVVVFMTDGSMNECIGGNQCGCNCPQTLGQAAFDACIASCASPIAFPHLKDKCDAIKQDPDVTLWAVTFGSDVNNDPRNAEARLHCASKPDQSVHVANG